MTLDEAQGEAVGIWPDNLAAVNVFIALSTQWRVGFGGPTGLDYGAVAAVLDLYDVPQSDRLSLFQNLREMEDAALCTMASRKK